RAVVPGCGRDSSERGYGRSGTVSPTTGPHGATVRFPRLGRVAELADAQDSGSCDRKIVGGQVPPRPRLFQGGATPRVSPRHGEVVLAQAGSRDSGSSCIPRHAVVVLRAWE